MKYTIQRTSRFKHDFKLALRRGCKAEELEAVLNVLASGGILEERYCDHELSGKFKDVRECHIRPDWLLTYIRDDGKLILLLLQTGTHSDIFGR